MKEKNCLHIKHSALFTSDLNEKDQFEVNLPNKNLHHFMMFLRCTIDGYEDDLKGKFMYISYINTLIKYIKLL